MDTSLDTGRTHVAPSLSGDSSPILSIMDTIASAIHENIYPQQITRIPTSRENIERSIGSFLLLLGMRCTVEDIGIDLDDELLHALIDYSLDTPYPSKDGGKPFPIQNWEFHELLNRKNELYWKLIQPSENFIVDVREFFVVIVAFLVRTECEPRDIPVFVKRAYTLAKAIQIVDRTKRLDTAVRIMR